jgi:hypothetical protein
MSETQPEATPSVTASVQKADTDLKAANAKLRKIVNRVRGANDAEQQQAAVAGDSLLHAADELHKSVADITMLVDELEKYI